MSISSYNYEIIGESWDCTPLRGSWFGTFETCCVFSLASPTLLRSSLFLYTTRVLFGRFILVYVSNVSCDFTFPCVVWSQSEFPSLFSILLPSSLSSLFLPVSPSLSVSIYLTIYLSVSMMGPRPKPAYVQVHSSAYKYEQFPGSTKITQRLSTKSHSR